MKIKENKNIKKEKMNISSKEKENNMKKENKMITREMTKDEEVMYEAHLQEMKFKKREGICECNVAKLYEKNVITLNEARELLGYDPVEGKLN